MRVKSNWAAGSLLGFAMATAGQTALAQQIEEIVVTSRRQGEEKLMETPLAITAFDADAIESKGITNLQDVANLTPGLSFFNPLGESLPTPVIRGVVPQDIFGENAAAIFIDGVYVAGREGLNFSQLDIERIEVMKGPQSSAYGRNAFSGAINYVTKPPSDVFETKIDADIGNRGKQKIMGQISGPIFGETLTGRVSVLYDEWDGSYDNTLAPGSDIGGYRYRSYQGKLRWRPTDDLDINFAVYRSNDEIDDFAAGGLLANCEDKVNITKEESDLGRAPGPRWQTYCGKVPKLRNMPQMLDAGTFPDPVPVPGSVRRDAMPKVPEAWGEARDLTRTNLSIAWDTDHGSLTALTGYSFMKENMVNDFNRLTGNATPFVYCYPATLAAGGPPTCDPTGAQRQWSRFPAGVIDIEPGPRVEEWSQELRWTSPRDQQLRWQAGGYYFNSTLKDHKGNPALTTPLPAGLDFREGGNAAFGPVVLPGLAIGSYIMWPSAGSYGLPAPYAGLDPLNRPFLKLEEESWSLFGAVDYDFTDRLKGRAEMRYTQNRKHGEAYNHTPCLDPRDFQDPVASSVTQPPMLDMAVVAACGDEFWDLRADSAEGYPWILGGQVVQVPGMEERSARFADITGRLGLDYTFDSGWMVYGSVARGKKPGGINILPAKEVVYPVARMATIFNDFKQEEIVAYELGLKGYTADRRISLDIALFFNDWKDIILRQLTEAVPGTGEKFRQPQGINVNSGNAHVYGWEMTTNVAMTDNLAGRVTLAYTDSKMVNGHLESLAQFDSFYTDDPTCAPAVVQALPVAAQNAEAARCRALSGDISGTVQMRQPEWTASVSLDYKRQLVGDWDLMSSLSANYIDKIFVGNDNLSWIPSNSNVNFNIGVQSPRYTVQLWVRNLLDNDQPRSAYRDIFWTNDSDLYATVPSNSGNVGNVSNFDDFPPMRFTVSYPSLRTWGLTAKMRFGGAEK